MPKEKKIEPLVQALCSYFDWEENSEQAQEVNASILAVKATARQQGYEAGMAAERERVVKIIKTVASKIERHSYDGNNLRDAADYYNIGAQDWTEIIRLEDGHNLATNSILSALSNDPTGEE